MVLAQPAIPALMILLAIPASAQDSPPAAISPSPGQSPRETPQPKPTTIRVVYPGPDDVVRVRDSSFLLGSVSNPDARLTINGASVRVWPNGAWLAWIQFPPERVMQFRIEARYAGDSSVLNYAIRRDPRYLPGEVRVGNAWVDTMSLTPQGQIWIPRNEYLNLSVRAVEGSQVRVYLPDRSSVRLLPQRQPEEVLPATRGFDRDTTKLRTPDEVRYVGVVRGRPIGPDPGPVLPEPSASIPNRLARADRNCETGGACSAPHIDPATPERGWAIVESVLGRDTVRARWPLQVALLDTLPLVVELDDDSLGTGETDGLAQGRAVPGGAYHWFFPTGTRATVSGRMNEDLRLRLSPAAEAWVRMSEARPLPRGVPPPRAVASSVLLTPMRDRVALRIPLTQRVPFQIVESDRTLTLTFYGAVADVDWIHHEGDSLIQRMSWLQTSQDELAFTVELAQPVWGYRSRWSRNDLVLEIRHPPRIERGHPLRGRVIAVDPGHPPLGTTGPTGLREAEANLAVALRLRALLEAAGARVIMTRTVDTAVDLWPRLAVAEGRGAELFVSIHNDALPDGVNPYTNNGTGVFYNRPRSVPLAADIQRALVRRFGLPDRGISRGDLAVLRTTWMPSVLCEGMFLILPDREAALRTARGQRLYAQGVFDGIRRFLGNRAKHQPFIRVGQAKSGASPKAIPATLSRAPVRGAPKGGVAP